MSVEKTNRVWDFLVLWPFIYLALLFVIIPVSIMMSSGGDPEDWMLGSMLLMMLLVVGYFATIVIGIVIYVYSIHRLYTKTNLPDDKKKMWLVLVILFNMITIPILHFTHLRK